uniref:Uncharacterized protein n=1 Tax=Trypanosoma congolense (strain IL3000) TaxID=1068625 RepID=G0UL76_TRYCI|nr:hypothetical protein, unlikely [Trypanosoma congolense IL3000]
MCAIHFPSFFSFSSGFSFFGYMFTTNHFFDIIYQLLERGHTLPTSACVHTKIFGVVSAPSFLVTLFVLLVDYRSLTVRCPRCRGCSFKPPQTSFFFCLCTFSCMFSFRRCLTI